MVRGSFAFSYIIPKLIPRIAAELGEDPATADPVALITKRAAIDICTAHEMYCVGENKQYEGMEECMHFIMYERPFGEVWQSGLDTGVLFSPLPFFFNIQGCKVIDSSSF